MEKPLVLMVKWTNNNYWSRKTGGLGARQALKEADEKK